MATVPLIRQRRVRRSTGISAIVLVVSAAAAGGWFVWEREASDREVLALLHSSDAGKRKQGTHLAGERRCKAGLRLIRERLDSAGERDAEVREAYYYLLARMLYEEDWPRVEAAIRHESSGFARQEAWRAAVLISPENCRALLGDLLAGDDWDRLGRAHARFALGDCGGVGELLRIAEHGDDAQRGIAGGIIDRYVRPQLDMFGRWPLEAAADSAQPWPPELIRKIRRRCGQVDVQAAMTANRRIEEDLQKLRRLMGRLSSGRERLVRMLLGPQASRLLE